MLTALDGLDTARMTVLWEHTVSVSRAICGSRGTDLLQISKMIAGLRPDRTDFDALQRDIARYMRAYIQFYSRWTGVRSTPGAHMVMPRSTQHMGTYDDIIAGNSSGYVEIRVPMLRRTVP